MSGRSTVRSSTLAELIGGGASKGGGFVYGFGPEPHFATRDKSFVLRGMPPAPPLLPAPQRCRNSPINMSNAVLPIYC